MRVSELVTIDEINSWRQDDIITIKAGTGKGKSYFIKNSLYAIAKRDNKKILMLIHRRNCTDQFLMEIEEANKTDNIDIRTYQSIEAVEKSGIIYELSHYDYIVCDEWHFFMSDSAFNQYTDLSLNAILEQTRAIKIFMSATDDRMKYYLTNKDHKGLSTIDYELPIDFKFIKRLEFFYKDETFEAYINQAIERNEKSIFFIQSATKAYKLFEKYKEHSIFNCGKNNKHYKHVDPQQIEDILKNEGYNKVDKEGSTDSTKGKLFLITTTVMDTGVNIVDDELNHIIVDVSDTGTLIQCIGRKRLRSKDDHIILHIKALGNQRLGGMETQAKNKLDLAEYFLEHGQKKLVRKKYRKLNSNLIYDEIVENGIEKRLNMLMFYKIRADLNEIYKIKEFSGKHPYCRYLAENVFRLGHFTIYEEVEKRDNLEKFLDGIVGNVMLQAKDREELIEKLNVRDGRNNRLLKGIETLNGMLKENEFDYMIDQFRASKQVNGKRKNYNAAWRVRRLSDD